MSALPSAIALPLALVAGCLAALGFAPLDLWPLTLAMLAVLLGLVSRAASARTAAGMGWLFGTGMFAVSLNWIATAFTYQAKMPAALGWVAVIGLAMYLALFIALPAGLAALLNRPAARLLAFAGLWIPAELARGLVLTGFAWNPIGAIWLPVTGMAQLASLAGAAGLSLAALVAAAGLVWVLMGPGSRARAAGGGVLLAVFAAATAGESLVRDSGFIGAPLIVVQPGIGQGERYDSAARDRHLAVHLDLTRAALARAEANARADLPDTSIRAAGIADLEDVQSPLRPATGKVTGQLETNIAAGLTVPPADAVAAPAGASAAIPAGDTQAAQRPRPQSPPAIILWPEGSIDGLIEEDAVTRARIGSVLRPGDLLLGGGTGVSRRAGAPARYANSLFVLDADGRVRGRYDKAHLVPLGEYVPWRSVLEPLGIARLVPGDFDFAMGPGPRTLALPGFLGVAPVICYEIAFPGAVVQETPRPAWIANVSNDAWFGAWGPPQHVAQARLRAIEEGLPIARATPTGQSVVIDGYGRVVSQVPGTGPDVIVTTLPPPLPVPLFAQVGPALALLGAALLAGLGLLLGLRGGRPEPAAATLS